MKGTLKEGEKIGKAKTVFERIDCNIVENTIKLT